MRYIIPNFYDSEIYNQTLVNEFISSKEFCGIQGNFSFCYFNGGVNNTGGQRIALYKDFLGSIEAYTKINENILLDFGNLEIEEKDYTNCMAKVLLEEYADDERVYFEVAHLGFLEYLINNYKNIKIILHQNYTLFHNIEEINQLISIYPDNIKGVIIHSNMNFKEIKKIKAKKYYLFSPHQYCAKCKNIKKCIKLENNNLLNYSEKSAFSDCQLFHTLKNKEDSIKELLNVKDSIDYVIFGTALKKKSTSDSFSMAHNEKALKQEENNEDIEIFYYKLYEDILGGIEE